MAGEGAATPSGWLSKVAGAGGRSAGIEEGKEVRRQDTESRKSKNGAKN